LAVDPDRDLKLRMAHKILDDWDTIVSLLPANWEQLAEEHRQLETKHGNAKITNAGDLLRLILVHAAADLPLRQTVALMAQAGGPSISPMRLHKKMVRAGSYLHALVTGLVHAPMNLSPEKWAGYVVSMVDATVVSRPGSVNGDARIHHRMRIADLKYLQVRSTGIDEGETFCRFDFEPGELVVADRGYCNARGVAHVLDAGADVLVRLNRTSMPMLWPATRTPLDIMSTLRGLPGRAVIEQDVLVPHKVRDQTRYISGRLCMMRLPEHEARKARERARKEQGSDVSAETLEAAGYIVLFTTTPTERLSAAQCIELYRLRWQIELQFKRWKSLCGFDRMPNFKPETIESWLYAKILSAVLLDKLTSLHSEVSPPIDYDYEDAPAAGSAALEADPTALAFARLRSIADQAVRAASQCRRSH
jgi:Transposase DDE domain